MKYCLNCKNPLDNKKKKYCSNKCQKEFEYRAYIEKWKNNQVSGMRGDYQLSMYIRRYIFEKYNNKCALCGWSRKNTFTGQIPLEIEHIDGNFENNEENNLILLCPNCHALTATYKGANLNRGRKARKKYNL